MSRLDENRKKELQPTRLEFAKDQLIKAGYEIIFEDETRLEIMYRGSKVQFFPFTGWHTGKTIVDGRGIHNLLKQIK